MRGWILMLALLSGACSEPSEEPQAPPAVAVAAPDPYAPCGTSPDPALCQADVEAGLLARSGGRALRLGDTLWINPSSAAPVPLGNDPERFVSYTYHGPVDDLDAHVARVGFFEGGGFVLVDGETGNQTQIYSPPLVAPGGERFATTSLDLVAGHDPNGVEIWAVTPSGPRLEWRVAGGESWGAEDPAWSDPRTLDFTRHAVVPGEPEPVRTRMRLTLGDTSFELRPAESSSQP